MIGKKNTEEEIEQTPAKFNPWYRFMLATIKLDNGKNQKPYGWHWFWGMYHLKHQLKSFDLTKILNTLPNEHWLKNKTSFNNYASDSEPKVNPLLEELFDDIGRPPITSIIDFSNLYFDTPVNFSNFIFPIKTDFSNTTFSKDALFSDAIFFETALFKNVKFHGERAKFKSTIFKKMVDFSNATFKHYANFANSKFGGRTSFQNATFERHAPRLYRAELNKEVTWDNITWPIFPSVFWALRQDILRRIKPKSADMEYVERVRENQNSYEDLANHMEDLNKYHDQHLFFRREMGCRRRLENYFIRLFYWLYEKLSNYGYGVGHAFVSWFLHTLIGALILFGLRYFNCFKDFTDDFGCSLGISLSNSHAFFFKGKRLKDCYDAFESLPWFNVIWGVQTITGTLLIFLVLLTLRVRFRLK